MGSEADDFGFRPIQHSTIKHSTDCTHKTILKLLFNPILTKFGWIIVSVFDETNNFICYQLRHYPENCSGPFKVWFNLFRKIK
jgi:hypothetical protein